MSKFTQDSTSLTLSGFNIHNACHRECEHNWPGNSIASQSKRAGCKVQCNKKYGAPEHYSQVSEKLAASANNLLEENAKLLFITDEIDNYNSMNF